MKLRWKTQALADREAIYNFIAERDREAAEAVDARVWEEIRGLVDGPRRGRPGRVTGTVELVVHGTPYIVVYRMEAETVRILRIMHGAQKWPARMP